MRANARRDLAIAVGAMVLAALTTLPALLDHGGNPTTLLRVGQYAAARPFVERDFTDPVLTPDYGHDGQQFYVIARSLPDVRPSAPYVDRLRYRTRRILFPLLVSPFPTGAPTVWAMFALNLASIGAAAVALAHLARRLAAPDWAGLAAGVSLAMVESLQGSLADSLAFALALWGVVLWRRSLGWAVALFTLAAMTRETTLVVPFACLVVALIERRRPRPWALLVPAGAYMAWVALVAWWIPPTPGSSANTPLGDAASNLTAPFVGWARVGLSQPGPMLGAALVIATGVAAWSLRRRLPEVAAWLLIDAVLLVCSDVAVAERPYNLARVAPMAFPALVLALLAGRARAPAVPRSPTTEPAPS